MINMDWKYNSEILVLDKFKKNKQSKTNKQTKKQGNQLKEELSQKFLKVLTLQSLTLTNSFLFEIRIGIHKNPRIETQFRESNQMLGPTDSKCPYSFPRWRVDCLLLVGDINELDIVATHNTECMFVDETRLRTIVALGPPAIY